MNEQKLKIVLEQLIKDLHGNAIPRLLSLSDLQAKKLRVLNVKLIKQQEQINFLSKAIIRLESGKIDWVEESRKG